MSRGGFTLFFLLPINNNCLCSLCSMITPKSLRESKNNIKNSTNCVAKIQAYYKFIKKKCM